MYKDKITVERIVYLSGEKIAELVSGWSKPMIGIKSDKGYHIIHMHHSNDFKVGQSVVVKRDLLRGAKKDIDFIAAR